MIKTRKRPKRSRICVMLAGQMTWRKPQIMRRVNKERLGGRRTEININIKTEEGSATGK